MKRSLVAAGTLIVVAGLARDSRGNEGQWTPDQIAQLDAAKLKGMGLQLSAAQLWDPKGDERTGGLLRAAVKLNGCTGAFVSDSGLIATNHHCAYGALQANSDVEHDYLRDGFLAQSKAQELQAKGKTVRVLRKQSDVTAKIRPAADALDDDQSRAQLIDRKRKELVDACEAASDQVRCEVASFYNGREYRLFEYLELKDLRVVYAPPSSVGEYGGEIDNWMWPRHTGDFSLLRAYVGPGSNQAPAEYSAANQPYTPGQWLKVSTEGVSPGDFVGVLGFPGRTQRYLSSAEVQRNIDQVLPGVVDLYGEWISILEEQGAGDPAVKIKVAALKKSLANRHKNARGMLDGLDHMQLLNKRKAEEEKLAAWAKAPGRERYAKVLAELHTQSELARHRHELGTLLSAARRGPNSMAIAIDLVRRARARKKPDIERPSGFRERDESSLWRRQERRLRDYNAEVDAQLVASLLARAAKLDAAGPNDAGGGAGSKAPAMGELSRVAASKGGRPGERRSYIGRGRSMVNGSSVTDATKLATLWAEATPETLARSKDSLIVAANSLVDLMDGAKELSEQASGARARLRPLYFDMLKELRGGPIYPDANGTLRMSYASVRGYTKWDGAEQTPLTTLTEAVAKHTGAEPFDLPAKVRQGAKAAKQSYWADPALQDLPVCFLADADTTGGNSGSPVIDGQGRLVGFNFDRVWENIGGDFAYFDGHSRNVSADVRHLLWMLDDVEDAGALLDELGVSKFRDAPARRPIAPEPGAEAAPTGATGATGPTGAPPPAASPALAPESSGACACSSQPDAPSGPLSLMILGLLGLWRGSGRGGRHSERAKTAGPPR